MAARLAALLALCLMFLCIDASSKNTLGPSVPFKPKGGSSKTTGEEKRERVGTSRVGSGSVKQEREQLYEAYNLLHTLAQDFRKPFDSPAVLVVGHQVSKRCDLSKIKSATNYTHKYAYNRQVGRAL